MLAADRPPRAWLLLGLLLILVSQTPSVPAQAQAVSAGSLDLSFGGDGIVTTDFDNLHEHLRAVTVQSDGKIVAAGYTQEGHSFDFAVVRYNAAGKLDTSFGTNGKVTTDFGYHAHIHSMALQPDGKIVVVGHTFTRRSDDFMMARYNANGTLDASFGTNGKVTTDFNGGFDYAFGVAVQPDGKIVVSGSVTVGGTYDFGVARYNADGSLDTSFGTNGKVTTEFAPPQGKTQGDQSQALALQSDGKIVAAGYSYTSKPGGEVSSDFALARYNKNGSLDTSFGTNGKVTTHFGNGNDRIYKLAVQPNGKIVAMGRSFSDTNDEVDFEVARYNPDGSLDTSFGGDGKVRTDLGYGEYGYAGGVQPDGKILVAGYLYDAALGDAPASHDQLVVRYNANGSLDTSFGGDGVVRTDIGGEDQVYALALQPDGKILVAGNSGIGGNYDFAVARYHGRAQQQTRSGGGSSGGGSGSAGGGGRSAGGGGGGSAGGGGGSAGGGGGSAGGGGGGETAVSESLPPGASELFEDVSEGAWYESAVTWMILHRVTTGCAPDRFCPEQTLTRQQFVTFLWRAAGKPTPTYQGSEAFADVTEGGYSDQAIGWAVSNQITIGCTPGAHGDPTWRFCPTDPLTRGQMATLLYRHTEADYQGQPSFYIDVQPEDFYSDGVVWLTDFLVVPGCHHTRFCPNRDATRAEAALFINGVAIRPHIWGEGNTSFIPQP